MATNILIYGDPGSGKSTALRNLNPSETFIINVIDKELPFRGWKKNYTRFHPTQNPAGNYFSSTNYQHILQMINYIDQSRPDIKVIILDDIQYVMADEFMRRASEEKWEKFNEIAQHIYKIFKKTRMECRPDLKCIFLGHSEKDPDGTIKFKTIGKMIDEKIRLEGMFTIVLFSFADDEKNLFLTTNHGNTVAKAPMGMFEDYIENDLAPIIKTVDAYNNGDELDNMPNMKKLNVTQPKVSQQRKRIRR